MTFRCYHKRKRGYIWMSIIKDKQQRQYVQHNLRTHLTVIKGNAEMLDKYYFDNGSKEKQILSKILEHAKELEDFLDEL